MVAPKKKALQILNLEAFDKIDNKENGCERELLVREIEPLIILKLGNRI